MEKYCYTNSTVLKNKFDIKNNEVLTDLEREITSRIATELRLIPIKGNLDYKHLRAIHKALFSEIYTWAGKERVTDISKGNSLFAKVAYISSYAEKIFANLKKENYLINFEQNKIIERLAYYFGEFNALHPFREGNGRTTRQFIGYLAKVAGFDLNFQEISRNELLNASIKSMHGDNFILESILKKISEPITFEERKEFIKSLSNEIFDLFVALGK